MKRLALLLALVLAVGQVPAHALEAAVDVSPNPVKHGKWLTVNAGGCGPIMGLSFVLAFKILKGEEVVYESAGYALYGAGEASMGTKITKKKYPKGLYNVEVECKYLYKDGYKTFWTDVQELKIKPKPKKKK